VLLNKCGVDINSFLLISISVLLLDLKVFKTLRSWKNPATFRFTKLYFKE
jgi:hypothetical protein